MEIVIPGGEVFSYVSMSQPEEDLWQEEKSWNCPDFV
jgi:hypothetical protein